MTARLAACCVMVALACSLPLAAQSDSWQKTTASLGSPVTAILPSNSGLVFAASANGAFIRSTDRGATWTAIPLPGEAVVSLAADSLGGVIAGTTRGAIRSVDRGLTWLEVELAPDTLSIARITVAADGTIYAGTPQGLYRTPINGAWTATAKTDPISAIATVMADELYISSSFTDAARSTDQGATWTPIPTGSMRIVDMTAQRSGIRKYIFAAGTDGLYRSPNRGKEWETLQPPGSRIFSSIVLSGQSNLYASGLSGVVRSVDTGFSWSALNDGLEGSAITKLAASADGSVYAGSSNGNIYKLTPSSSAPGTGARNGAAALLESIPNPTAGMTQLPFSLSRRETITLTVHDLLGNTVAVVAGGTFDAGAHEPQWNAAGAAPGIYFYTIRGNGWSQTRTLVVRH